jgi:hypothetical protein
MARSVWPTELPFPDLGFTEKSDDPGILFEVEDGPPISRRRKTRIYETFNLEWNKFGLTPAEYITYKTFINDAVGGSSQEFDWPHPVTHDVYVVRCIGQTEWKWAADGEPYWKGGATFRGYKP